MSSPKIDTLWENQSFEDREAFQDELSDRWNSLFLDVAYGHVSEKCQGLSDHHRKTLIGAVFGTRASIECFDEPGTLNLRIVVDAMFGAILVHKFLALCDFEDESTVFKFDQFELEATETMLLELSEKHLKLYSSEDYVEELHKHDISGADITNIPNEILRHLMIESGC